MGLTRPLTGWTGSPNNIQVAESAGNYQAVLENFLLSPTTVANDFLNGYQPGNAGTPFTDLISPEFGFLTNPDTAVTATTTPLATGTIDAFQIQQQTLADELSATGGADLTSKLPLLGPGMLELDLNVDKILGGLLPNGINLPVGTLLSDAGITGSLATLIEKYLGNSIPIPVSTLEAILSPTGTLGIPVNIPGIDTTVPSYAADLSHDLLAVAGSVGPLSSALPTLLMPDPSIDVVPPLTGLLTDLGLPVSIVSGSLPLDLTGVTADVLENLIPVGTSSGGLDLGGLLGGLDLSGLLGGTDLGGLLDVGGSGLTSLPLDIGSALLSIF